MELVTLKQFAEEKGITYEAVRKQTIKYADELEGHIVTVDWMKKLRNFSLRGGGCLRSWLRSRTQKLTTKSF